MKVLNLQFLQAMKSKLDALKPGFYYTREQLCADLKLPKEYATAVSLAMLDPMFDAFEMVKSRGIRRRAGSSLPKLPAAKPIKTA